MKNLNTYIYEAWSGVKKQTNIENIKVWCDDMDIKNYTINSQGEIDVDGSVWTLKNKNFKELPYKFGKINGYFDISNNPNLTSLKNCPDKVEDFFRCSLCPQLDSLEGCPKEVGWNFYCSDCKRKFTEKEVKTLCKVKGKINFSGKN